MMIFWIRILFFLFFVKPFLLLFIGLRIVKFNNLPNRHPFIIIANHSSHLDTVALMHMFPLMELHRIRPVAAADYFFKYKIRAWLSTCFFNILPIERKRVCKDQNPLDAIGKAIENKQSLIFFPEGTRSASGEIGKFHSGIAHIIKIYPDVPVIPVYLCNMWKSMPKGEFLPVPVFCEIIIGKPFFPDGSRKEIMEQCEKKMLHLKESSKTT